MALQPWRRIETTWLVDHPFAAVVEDLYELPNGAQVRWARDADEREGRTRHPIAGAVCRRDDGRVLVAFQWNPGPQQVVEEFPGGAGEAGETAEDCIRRELQEEVGLYPHRLEHLGQMLPSVRRRSTAFDVFLASELEERRLDGDPNEFIEVAWLEPAEIDDAIKEGRFRNAILLASWAMYRARYPAT